MAYYYPYYSLQPQTYPSYSQTPCATCSQHPTSYCAALPVSPANNGVNPRKRFSPEQKLAMVKQHLVDRVPIPNLCQQHGMRPDQYMRWQEQLFANGAAAFKRKSKPARPVPSDSKVQELEEKVALQKELIAQLLEECKVSPKGNKGT